MIKYNISDINRTIICYENPYLDEDKIIYNESEGCFIASTKMYRLINISFLNRERKNKLEKINGKKY